MLGYFARIPRNDFEIGDDAYAALGLEVARWRSVLERPSLGVDRQEPEPPGLSL